MKNILVTGDAGFIGSNFIRFVLGEAGEYAKWMEKNYGSR